MNWMVEFGGGVGGTLKCCWRGGEVCGGVLGWFGRKRELQLKGDKFESGGGRSKHIFANSAQVAYK